MTQEDITKLVKEKVSELGEERDKQELIDCTEHTPLYSPKGNLDSLTLVFLISELEEAVEEQFGAIITLADERAMSQKISPFRSVNSISHYIYKLINTDG